jgi:hypothetical protein
MIKGYRTYVAIVLTAAVSLAQSFGYITPDVSASLVAVLSAAGLYFRSQAGK